MTITFRVEDGSAILAPMAAIITPDQLASLRDLLADQSLRLGFALLLPGSGVTGDPWFEFDARVCHLSLAVVSKCFDHDPSVIAILDEAQFLGRRVRVAQTEPTGDITMRLSLNPDAAPEIALANRQAGAVRRPWDRPHGGRHGADDGASTEADGSPHQASARFRSGHGREH